MHRHTVFVLVLIVFVVLFGYFFYLAPPQLARPARPPDPNAINQFSASRQIDAELRNSIPSYIGLSITSEHEIKLTLANRDEFQTARSVAAAKLAQLLRENPNNPFNRELGRASFSFVEAPLGPQELAEARAKMRDVLTLAKTVYLGIDKSCGCIAVGISDSSAEANVRSFATQQGIPPRAIKIVLTSPVISTNDLQGSFRPTMGGAQIRSKVATGLVADCTLGLPVFSLTRNKPGFLTASHCTTGPRGDMQGTWFGQPGGAAFWSDKIGVESIDRAMFDSSTDPLCPSGRMCRYSDVAFIDYDNADLGIMGRIVRPQNRCVGLNNACDLKVERQTDDIRVVLADATDPNAGPMIGEAIDKVGRTTGWTSGPVLLTCFDTQVGNDDGSDTGITLLCQNIVGATVDHGDSGSPVFAFDPTTGAAMFEGILSGSALNKSFFHYSPVSGIEKDLGPFAYNERGVTAPFFSSGEFFTSDTNDEIDVLVEPNAVAADRISVVLKSGPGINWKKQLVVVGGGSPPANLTLTVINSAKMDSNFLQIDQLPAAHLEFRKLYWAHTATDEVSRVPLDRVPPGTRLTFTWNKD